METRQFTPAFKSYSRVLLWQPPGMSADLWYSRSLAAAIPREQQFPQRFELWRRSKEAAIRAADKAEEPANAWYSFAQISALEGDAKATERGLREAIAASPNWYKPHWTLAELLRMTGRLDEARDESAIAVARSGGKREDVLRTAQTIETMTQK
jgi:hypothetical protein